MAARKTKRKCLKKRRVRGVLRCVRYSKARGKRRVSGRHRRGEGPTVSAAGSRMWRMDARWCQGHRTGFPPGYSPRGMRCSRKHWSGTWKMPSIAPAQIVNREKRARKVRWTGKWSRA